MDYSIKKIIKKLYLILPFVIINLIFADTVTFTKESFADWTLPENQDCITENVCITRRDIEGIFNIVEEESYDDIANTSPLGTEWSYGNTEDLSPSDYENWKNAVNGSPSSMVGQPMSLHLIEDDMYFDIEFHSWGQGIAGGGSFSYTRTNISMMGGCTDETACNYDAEATEDDGSCEYPEENFDCEGNCIVNVDCIGECDGSASYDHCGVCDDDLTNDCEVDPFVFTSPENHTAFCADGDGIPESLTIEWTGGYSGGNVNIAYIMIPEGSTGSGTVQGYVASDIANSGSYTWTYPFEELVVDADYYFSITNWVDDIYTGLYGYGSHFSISTVDDCGICGGGNADLDCTGECGGSAFIDECGVCNGDGQSCHIYIDFSLGDGAGDSLDIFMSNSHNVTGFQFDIDGMDISGASGGRAEGAGFDVATGPNGVLGVSFTGGSINPGGGLLTRLSGSFTDLAVTLTGIIVTTDSEGFLHLTGEGVSSGTDAVEGCDGVINSGLEFDECGECDGDGINEGEVELWGACYDIATTTFLELDGLGLTGEIPPQIGELINLNWLDLGENELSGQIPPEIGNIEWLQNLQLQNNQLTGEIPYQIFGLLYLDFLYLNNNQLSGEISTGFCGMWSLHNLNLSNNQFSGEIPACLGCGLELGLTDNQLSGEIPYDFCYCSLYGSADQFLGNNQFCPPPEICYESANFHFGEQDNLNCFDLGDINQDLYIDILDVVLGISIILGNIECTDDQLYLLDLNEDGSNNIIDLVEMVNIIMGN